jgi:hypothetical protein
MKTNAEIVEGFDDEFKNKSLSRRRPAVPRLAECAPLEETQL